MTQKCTPRIALTIDYIALSAAGVWPIENPDTYYKLKTFLAWLISWSILFTMIAETIADLNDFAKLSGILYIMITFAAYLIKLFYFTYHRRTFIDMLKYLDGEVFVSYPDDLDRYMVNALRFTTRFTHCYRLIVAGMVMMYFVFPFTDAVDLPFPFPYEFGPIGRIFMYLFQMAGEVTAAWVNVSLDCICAALMSIGDAQFDILVEKIERLPFKKSNEDGGFEEMDQDAEENAYLKQCIVHHLAIIRYIQDIEKIFTVPLLTQFISSVIVICNTVFNFVLIPFSSAFAMLIFYSIALLQQIFMYCWYGDNIIWKSKMVGDACYGANWHYMGKSTRKSLFVIMERSKRPLRITTMSFATLSLSAFLSILQWSYSYFTLLLRMYYKRDQ